MTEPFALLGGRLVLAGPRPAEDALWLAAAVSPPPGSRVLDAMAGIGTVGLALMARCPGLAVTGVEIDPTLAALANANAARNNQAGYAAHAHDLASAPQSLGEGTFDCALMNPPFHATARGHATPCAAKALAHGLPPGRLAGWLECLHALTTPAGTIALILHAACREDLLAFAKARACAAALRPLQTAPGKPAKRLLATLAKAATFSCAEHPPLPAHNPALREDVLKAAKGLPALCSQETMPRNRS